MIILNFLAIFRKLGKKAKANVGGSAARDIRELEEEIAEKTAEVEGRGAEEAEEEAEDVKQLEQAAAKDLEIKASRIASDRAAIHEKIDEAHQTIISLPQLVMALVLALVFDAVDLLGIGVIPIIGDVFDIAGIVLEYGFIHQYALAGLIELIPLGITDLLPCFVFAVLLAYGINRASNQAAYGQLKALKTQLNALNQEADKLKEENGILVTGKSRPSLGLRFGMPGWGAKAILAILVLVAFTFALGAFPGLGREAVAGGFIAAAKAPDAAEEATAGFTGFIQKTTEDLKNIWKYSEQRASGEYLTGDVKKEEPAFVGLELLEPYTPNPKQYFLEEAPEIGARIHVNGYKTQIATKIRCFQRERSLVTPKVINIYDVTQFGNELGDDNVYPNFFEAKVNYEEPITCYPNFGGSGDFIITLIAEGRGMFVSADLQNYFVDKEQEQIILDKIGEAQEKPISKASTETRKFYSVAGYEIPEPISFSGKGPIKLIIVTKKSPVVGISDTSAIKVQMAIDNLLDGVILDISEVTLRLPEGFEKVPGKPCEQWEPKTGASNELVLKQKIGAQFSTMKKLEQKRLPSCSVRLKSGAKDKLLAYASEPMPETFILTVRYDYSVYKEYKINVKREIEFDDVPTATTACTGTIFEARADVPKAGYNTEYYGSLDHKACKTRTKQREVDTIVLHHTGGKKTTTASQVIDWLVDEDKIASAHYFIDRDGAVYYVVDENMVAQHAGCGLDCEKLEYKTINSRSIGIELVNSGAYDDAFTTAQYNSLKSLITSIGSRHNFTPSDKNVIAHYEITKRKYDPSPNFDWSKIGLTGHDSYVELRKECPGGAWQNKECITPYATA